MTINTKTHQPISLDTKELIAALAIESFNFRNSVHVNVVATASDPSLCVFIYINKRCEKSITIFLDESNTIEQLQSAYDLVRETKKQGELPHSNLKLVG